MRVGDPALLRSIYRGNVRWCWPHRYVVARFYPDAAPARLVHDLAIRGADAVAEEEVERDEAIEQLVALSTGELDLFDREVLEHVDELAWGK